ncbi:UvrD-helicase domain-containing protein [Faunimonas sp. B44]|uniref:UvrD-helicase domain-containing protein n=1 Tax=Faunimonas sp. B44 TaxID=3461493 RepID=UPI004043EA33
MTLRIASSFTGALARLTPQEQGLVKQTAFDLQMGLARPGLALHRVDRAREKGFWTARVNDDIRIVLHRRGEATTLAYVDHHDDAYRWAETHRLDAHPVTGAAQLVEIRETVEEIVVPVYVAREAPKPPLFADTPEETLLRCGVPEDWLADVRAVDEDTIFALAGRLPAEAMEALLDLATGVAPPPPAPTEDPFAHPDAQRRFLLLTGEDDLRRALDAPWEDWAVFLHPAQREFVARDFAGPARVIGSAGTGKTVVALHRAVRLARANPDAGVLLTTFNTVLAAALRRKVATLVGAASPLLDRITVADLPGAAHALHERLVGPVRLADDDDVARALQAAKRDVGFEVDDRFLLDEWRLIVDGRQVPDRETYRDLPRLGRKRRLAGERREALWTLFEHARARLAAEGLTTYPAMLGRLATHLAAAGAAPFDHVVVDEAQDVSAAELRILAALAGARPNGLFFAGDIGQRIFRPPFSWKSEGVDIQGRSRSLRVNYRTSQQIRQQADGLLPSTLVEADGSEDDRRGVQSLFTGPAPVVRVFVTVEQEREAVSAWLAERLAEGLEPRSIALVVRSPELLGRAAAAAAAANAPTSPAGAELDAVRLATMHDVKGLEFRAVAVIACDEGVIPSEARMTEVSDEASLAEVYATERHLLYVACTRAREHLLVTATEPASEFLQDLSE